MQEDDAGFLADGDSHRLIQPQHEGMECRPQPPRLPHRRHGQFVVSRLRAIHAPVPGHVLIHRLPARRDQPRSRGVHAIAVHVEHPKVERRPELQLSHRPALPEVRQRLRLHAEVQRLCAGEAHCHSERESLAEFRPGLRLHAIAGLCPRACREQRDRADDRPTARTHFSSPPSLSAVVFRRTPLRRPHPSLLRKISSGGHASFGAQPCLCQ